MLRKKEEQALRTKQEMYEGQGSVVLRDLLQSEEEMNGKGRLFSVLTVQPGDSIGFHVHKGEAETFYILRGTGEFDDNGTPRAFSPGDVLYTAAGDGHGIRNTGAEPLEFVALILYE